MAADRPAPGCHPNPFRTRRLAARRAWAIALAGKEVTPYECPAGCGWHLADGTTTPTTTGPS